MFRRYFGIICAVIVGGTLGLFLWSAYSVVVLNRTDIYAENGLLENIQAVLLVIAGIAFFAPIAFEKRSDKLILCFCSLLCFSFVLRELDVEDLDVHDALKFIGSGAGRNTILAAAFIAVFSYAAFWFSYYKKQAVQFLRSKAGVLLMAGGVLLIVGEVFEKESSIAYHVYLEEMVELVGYVVILLAAFAA